MGEAEARSSPDLCVSCAGVVETPSPVPAAQTFCTYAVLTFPEQA